MSEAPTSPLIHDARSPAASAAAIQALRQDMIIVLPTETVYGLACNAASVPAAARLNALATGGGGKPSAWHAPSAEAVHAVIEFASPIHRRLVTQLLPGPVTLMIEQDETNLARIRAELKVPAGAIDDGKTVSVRVPDHALAGDLLRQAFEAGMPVMAQSIGAAGWGDGRLLLRGTRWGPSVGAVLDDGPTRLGMPSTAVRLLAAGGYRIEREGALAAKTIQRLAQRTILFVCTGNTCRSPMAEAIARFEIATMTPRESPPVPVNVESAGTDGFGNSPATPETIRAVESLGIDAGPLATHRSRALTAQAIDAADVVYAMTSSHARAARAINPAAEGKIKLLDPDGGDIPDPIGGTLEVYTRTAQRLRELIRRRLAENLD